MGGQPVGDGVSGDRGFIHLQEGDLAAVRGPELVAAHAKLFLVNPIDLAVEEVGVLLSGVVFIPLSVKAHAAFLHAVDGFDHEAMVADEGNVFAVRGELGVRGGIGAGGELDGGSII